ncbi:hypothetical protein BHE74_00002139 [Ensete ventricosum]|nr:hypothetical protein BHE74_00002139 [Ensete ventricosum]
MSYNPRGSPEVTKSSYGRPDRGNGARPTFPSSRKHAARFVARTTEAVTKYDDMVSNRRIKDLRYGRLVDFTIKAPAPLRRGGRKIDNRTNLTVGEVTSGTPPDPTFLQDSTADLTRPDSTTQEADYPTQTREFLPSNQAPPLCQDDRRRTSAHGPEPAVPAQ